LFIKDDRWTFFLLKSEGAVYGLRFINFYSPFLVPFFKEEEMFLDVEGVRIGSILLVIIVLLSAKPPTKRCGYCWLVGYENVK
jgi:hypothetical protein